MQTCFLLILSTFLLLFVGEGEGGMPEMGCKDMMSELTKRQLKGVSACTKTMKFKNAKDKAAKMNCVLKCVMMKEGLLSADGTMSDQSFDSFIEANAPPNLKVFIFGAFKPCQRDTDPNTGISCPEVNPNCNSGFESLNDDDDV